MNAVSTYIGMIIAEVKGDNEMWKALNKKFSARERNDSFARPRSSGLEVRANPTSETEYNHRNDTL